MGPRRSERPGTPARGCPQDCRTRVTASVLGPRLGKRLRSPGGARPRPPRSAAPGERRARPARGRSLTGTRRRLLRQHRACPGRWEGTTTGRERAGRGFSRGGGGSRYKARPNPPHPSPLRSRRVAAAITHWRGRERRGKRQAEPDQPPLCETPGAAPLSSPPLPPGTHRRATEALPPPRTSGFRRGSGSGRYHRDAGAGCGGEASPLPGEAGGGGGWYIPPPPPSCRGEAGAGA